jgi:ferric-dicitrate binding protein FerR (iron transport regulator)
MEEEEGWQEEEEASPARGTSSSSRAKREERRVSAEGSLSRRPLEGQGSVGAQLLMALMVGLILLLATYIAGTYYTAADMSTTLPLSQRPLAWVMGGSFVTGVIGSWWCGLGN